MSSRLGTTSIRLAVAVAVGAATFAVIPQARAADNKDDKHEVRSETRDMLKQAHLSGEAVLSFSRVARKNAGDDVKKFAEELVVAHEAMNKDLADIADARHVTFDKKISDEDDKTHDRIAKLTGKEFDKAYLQEVVDKHNDLVKIYEGIEKNSEDPRLDKFVKDTLPKLREHRDAARDLLKKLDA